MPWNNALPTVIWAVICIPLTVLLWILRADNKLTAILMILDFVLVNVFFFISVSWAIINIYLEFIPLILSILIIFRLTGTRKWRKGSFFPKRSVVPLVITIVCAVILLAAGYLDFRTIQSVVYPHDQAILLYFPERNGLYVIANGGNGLDGIGANNEYQDWLGQKTSDDQSLAYSADIFKMSDRGYISNGILPSYFGDYLGYEDIVYSPCVGTVLLVEDGHPDVPALTRTTTDLGNYVVIACNDSFYVTLANLRNQSILVKPNDPIHLGLGVGEVGNSASNSIPHLHIHATRGDWSKNGKPTPMLFDGAFAVDQFAIRNKIYLP